MKAEYMLRFLYSFFFRGTAVKCVVCNASLSRFIELPSGDLLCPRCGSLPRHRRLWMLLHEYDFLNNSIRILHFSPSRILRKKMQQLVPASYITTDYDPEAYTDKHYDITHIFEPPESFELIICFHILEHITDDAKAIHELYRIAKKGAIVWIQTPFKEGDIYEDARITNPAERLLHFGQEDHIRIYSVEGLSKRIQEAGFEVNILQFSDDKSLGLKEEIILRCVRPK
ncbi:MAG: methyltransferase domain-containing protein [Bacteroidales bacterium]|nr:methyltransferase domain-containing protein [Bacteroidales bacterium]